MKCPRCETVERIPIEGVHEMVGPNGMRMTICTPCYDEVVEEQGGCEYFADMYNEDEED